MKHLIKYGHRVAFSPNGEWLAIVSYDNLLFDAEGYEIRCDKYVRLIKVATGAVRHVFKEHSFESVAFSPNSALLAMGSLDKNVRIIEVATGAVKYIIPQDDGVKSVAFSPNGQWLATGSSYRNARIIEVATGNVKHVFAHNNAVWSVAFSPNGELLATGSWDKDARIIEIATGVVKHAIARGRVFSVAFSPDGQWLATGSCDNYARIIEVATGETKQAIKHNDYVLSVAFSPNGKLLATGSGSTQIYAWYLMDNIKNAMLVSYLKSCQENKMQPDMRGWVLEAIQKIIGIRITLKNVFPGLDLADALNTQPSQVVEVGLGSKMKDFAEKLAILMSCFKSTSS